MKKGSAAQVAWIPEEHAKQDQFVKLKEDDGTWSDGWQVVTVGSHRINGEYLAAHEREFLNHRKVTDV